MNLFTENQFSQQPFESHSYSVTLWRWIHNFRLEWTHSEMEAKTMHAWLCKQINVINVIIVIWTLNQLFRLIIITIVVAVLASFLNWVGIALMTSTRERESEKTIKNRDTTIEGPKVIYRKCFFDEWPKSNSTFLGDLGWYILISMYFTTEQWPKIIALCKVNEKNL